MPSGFLTALRTLTILPFWGEETKPAHHSLVWFGSVGLILGALLWAAASLLLLWFSEAVTAFLLVALLFRLTGGLHLDGLADWADGLFAKGGRARQLEVMKDSRLGSFGAIALILVLLGKWLLFTELLMTGQLVPLLAVPFLSRTGMALMAAKFRYARSEGIAHDFVKESGSYQFNASLISALLILALSFGFTGILLGLLALVAALRFGSLMEERFEGITGDMLGAFCELSELLFLLMALVIPPLFNHGAWPLFAPDLLPPLQGALDSLLEWIGGIFDPLFPEEGP